MLKTTTVTSGLLVILALLGFVTVSRYVDNQNAPHASPTPQQKESTILDVAKDTLRANPNFQCPSVIVILNWLKKFNNETPDPLLYNDNPLLYSCYAVYQSQYQAEAQALDAQRRPIYRQPAPQLHSESCSVIGNTVSCIGF